MYEVYSIFTGQVRGTYTSIVKAVQHADNLTDVFSWIDGDVFAWRVKE